MKQTWNAELQRRDFLKLSAMGGALWMLPQLPSLALADIEDPHFFVQIYYSGGVDVSYLFDARRLAMKEAKYIHNYLNTDPQVWSGTRSGQTFATTVVDKLKPHASDFSVLNGVVMAHAFDGHAENMKFAFSGNPFGGEAFIPHLNKVGVKEPLDGVSSTAATFGITNLNLTNFNSTVPLSVDSASALVKGLKAKPPLDLQSRMLKFVNMRLMANSQGTGQFSEGSKGMAQALQAGPDLVNRLREVEPPMGNKSFLPIMAQLFKKHITKSVILEYGNPEFVFDAHAPTDCKNQPVALAKAMDKVVELIQFLKATPYDQTRSLYDLTTFMVTSEFGRSMRQKDKGMDETGTDHNPLANSVLVGGKGIRGGMVIGASDFQTPTEALSGAHLEIDRDKLRTMGRPFDFSTMQDREDKPMRFDIKDYLSFSSIVNTIYSSYGVSTQLYRTIDRNGTVAPILRGLLS
ncbi:MAG: DUF1501 domain-containing protein [Bdellovibrionales bacterium]